MDNKEYVVTEIEKYVNQMDQQPSDSILLLTTFLTGANVIQFMHTMSAMNAGMLTFSAVYLTALIGGIGIGATSALCIMLEKIKVNNQLKEFVKNQIEAMTKENQIEGK